MSQESGRQDASGRAGDKPVRSGSWVPMAGAAGIVLVLLLLVLLASQFGTERPDRLEPGPVPSSATTAVDR